MNAIEKVFLAQEMLRLGFYSRIISQETRLSKKIVVRLFKRAYTTGNVPAHQHRPGKEPTGAAIIKNSTSKMHASVVMNLYVALGGTGIFREFNFKALAKAFNLHAKALTKSGKYKLFDVNNMWYLAKELRERTATMEVCSACGCGYFHSINQRVTIDCPFCFLLSKQEKDQLEASRTTAA